MSSALSKSSTSLQSSSSSTQESQGQAAVLADFKTRLSDISTTAVGCWFQFDPDSPYSLRLLLRYYEDDYSFVLTNSGLYGAKGFNKLGTLCQLLGLELERRSYGDGTSQVNIYYRFRKQTVLPPRARSSPINHKFLLTPSMLGSPIASLGVNPDNIHPTHQLHTQKFIEIVSETPIHRVRLTPAAADYKKKVERVGGDFPKCGLARRYENKSFLDGG